MKNKVVVNTNCYHGYSADEALEGIAKAGFKYVELTATKGWTEHVFVDKSFLELQRIKDRVKELGLVVVAMSGHTSLMDSARLNDFINNIHLANFYEAEYIVSSVGEAHLEDMEHAGEDVVVENLKSFIPYLENYDMKLALEVHGQDHGSGRKLKEIISRVANPRIQIAYDTANAVFYGDVDPVEDLDYCVDWVNYLHLKDKAGGRQEWDFPALGDGYINIEGVLDVLKRNKNEAPLSIEIEFTQEGPSNLEEVNEAVIRSGNYLKSLGLELC